MIPDWLPIEAWQAFIEMRAKIKKPLTSYAEHLAIKHLDTHRQKGHDVLLLLDKSIFHNWQDFWPGDDTKVAPIPTWKERGFSNVESFQAAQEQQAQAKADKRLGG